MSTDFSCSSCIKSTACGSYLVEAGGDPQRGRKMGTSPTISLIDHLRRAVLLPDGAGLGDGELLGRFIERHDEAAFAVLVNRHGPMVWGVCSRMLYQHDAEDAFQATFLILVRKAASIRSKETVGNWLYGVAHQTALQAQRTAARRRAREVQVTAMPDAETVQKDQWADVQPLLEDELSRLPDIYRAVIVLCDLESRTRKEVACQLGVPEGTVAGRLARARTMLAKRLTQRGVTLSGGALAAVLAQQAVLAGAPHSVVASTIKAAHMVAVGKAATTGAISVKVAVLTEGVMKAMLFSKLKALGAVVLMLGVLATGTPILTCRTSAGQDDEKPTAEKPVRTAALQQKEQGKETFTAWGREVGGLQAGLGYLSGQKRPYSPGETVKLVVRVRNASKEEVQFEYLKEFFIETPPTVTDDKRKPVPLGRRDAGGLVHVPVKVNLAPGKEIKLAELQLEPRTQAQSAHEGQWNLFKTGKFSVHYERLAHPDVDKILGKLATGKLELEIKFDTPAASEKIGKGEVPSVGPQLDLDRDRFPDIVVNGKLLLDDNDLRSKDSKADPDRDGFPDVLINGQLLDLDRDIDLDKVIPAGASKAGETRNKSQPKATDDPLYELRCQVLLGVTEVNKFTMTLPMNVSGKFRILEGGVVPDAVNRDHLGVVFRAKVVGENVKGVLTELALDDIGLVKGKADIKRIYVKKHLGAVQQFSFDSKELPGKLTVTVKVQRQGQGAPRSPGKEPLAEGDERAHPSKQDKNDKPSGSKDKDNPVPATEVSRGVLPNLRMACNKLSVAGA